MGLTLLNLFQILQGCPVAFLSLGLKTDMAGGETSRRWEAERQDGRRAEARLIRGLQHLEDARLSYLNSMMKEQRRLQQELMRMQKSEELFPSSFTQCNGK